VAKVIAIRDGRRAAPPGDGSRGAAPAARGARHVLVEVGEAVAGAVDGVQQRLVERLVDHLAQVVEVAAQGVGVGQQVAPHLALDVAAADHPRRLAHQDGEQLQADRRDREVLAAALQAQRRGVEHQVAHAQHLGADLAAVAADQGAHARFQFADLERLDQVIVGAGVEADQLVLQRVAGGQHQHRGGALGVLAQLAAKIQTIHAGQHQVQHDHVVAVLGGQAQAGHAVRGIVEAVAAALEELADHLGDAAVVFDQQDQAGAVFSRLHGRGSLGCPTSAARRFTYVKIKHRRRLAGCEDARLATRLVRQAVASLSWRAPSRAPIR
jgi:D-alanyl-D-alanine carboxypeptidase/D-alanyl-D-alanine-endopeptidase (penicillin-binding protein 4)